MRNRPYPELSDTSQLPNDIDLGPAALQAPSGCTDARLLLSSGPRSMSVGSCAARSCRLRERLLDPPRGPGNGLEPRWRCSAGLLAPYRTHSRQPRAPRRRASFWRHPCEMRRRVAAATRGSARSPRARSLPARQAALLSRRRGDESGRRRRSRRVAGGAPLGGAPSRRRADVTGAAAAHDGAQWPPPPSPARPVDQGSGLSAVPSLNRHT